MGCFFTNQHYLLPYSHVIVFQSKCNSKVQATRLIYIKMQPSFRFQVKMTNLMLNACPFICVLL